MLANWIQAPSGPYGHLQMLNWAGGKPATVPLGITSVDLENYAAAIFKLDVPSVDYPGTQGTHILYAGIDSSKVVDLEAPFAVDGGVLVVLNTNPAYDDFTPEPSGPSLFPSQAPQAFPASKAALPRDRAWLHPPPIDPRHLDRLAAWRDRTRPR
jgi:hypothetical protein